MVGFVVVGIEEKIIEVVYDGSFFVLSDISGLFVGGEVGFVSRG